MSLTVAFITFSDCDFTQNVTTLTDTTGNPLHMQARSSADDPTVWIECSTANGRLTQPSSSVVAVSIPQSALRTLPAGVYVLSCIMTKFGGAVRSEVWRGTLTHSVGPTQFAAGTP